MKLEFRVHNPHRTQAGQTVNFRGNEVRAAIDAFEVELMAMDGASGTLKLRLMGEDIAEAETLFAADATIEVSFSSGTSSQEAA